MRPKGRIAPTLGTHLLNLEDESVIDEIENDIYVGFVLGMHFGLMCKSFGPASWFQPWLWPSQQP